MEGRRRSQIEEKENMPDERDPKQPPKHPTTGPLQPDTMPDQPRPPVAPSPKQEEQLRESGKR